MRQHFKLWRNGIHYYSSHKVKSHNLLLTERILNLNYFRVQCDDETEIFTNSKRFDVAIANFHFKATEGLSIRFSTFIKWIHLKNGKRNIASNQWNDFIIDFHYNLMVNEFGAHANKKSMTFMDFTLEFSYSNTSSSIDHIVLMLIYLYTFFPCGYVVFVAVSFGNFPFFSTFFFYFDIFYSYEM